jgi:hypothetical protein
MFNLGGRLPRGQQRRVMPPNRRFRPRPCEKTIAANHWAIYCSCAELRHSEEFGYTILRAIGLLVLVRVMTFHTASTLSRTEAAAHGAEVIYAGDEDLVWKYGLAICLCQIDLLSRAKDNALPGLQIG